MSPVLRPAAPPGAGLKVRLDDGSQVGPLDQGSLRSWFQQGLIDRDTLVQRERSTNWVRLAEAVDLSTWAGPADLRVPRGGARRAGDAPVEAEGAPDGPVMRMRVAAGFLGLLALAAALAAWRPELVRPELDGAPWLRLGLGLLAVGLALAPGWEIARRFARVGALVAAAAVFPLAGILLARGVRGPALLAAASAVVFALGGLAVLAPVLSPPRSALSIAALALGAAGLVRFSLAERAASLAAAWSSGDRRVADGELGLNWEVPPGWFVLKPGNPLLAPPAGARVALAQPRLGGFAFLAAGPRPASVLLLEHHLDHVIGERRASAASFAEEGRGDARLGSLPARQASSRRNATGGRVRERVVVAQDGERFLALVAWMPESLGERGLEEMDALARGLSLSGLGTAARGDWLSRSIQELPHLSAGAVESLAESAGAGLPDPSSLFRRSVERSARGRALLDPAAAQELDTLTATALGGLPPRERARLGAYLLAVAQGRGTTPAEDEEMRQLMKAAAARLDGPPRARLGELHESAIRAAAGGARLNQPTP